jgi:hypothetical protein
MYKANSNHQGKLEFRLTTECSLVTHFKSSVKVNEEDNSSIRSQKAIVRQSSQVQEVLFDKTSISRCYVYSKRICRYFSSWIAGFRSQKRAWQHTSVKFCENPIVGIVQNSLQHHKPFLDLLLAVFFLHDYRYKSMMRKDMMSISYLLK